MKAARVVLPISIAALVAACGTDTKGSGGGDSDTGAGTDTADTAGPDDATGDDGAGDGTAGGDTADAGTTGEDPEWSVPGDTLRTSYVSMSAYWANDIGSGTVIAAFYDQHPAPLTTATETMDECVIRTVNFGGDTGFPDYASAGTIMVSGGNEDLAMVPEAGNYTPYQSDSPLFTGGETLEVSAAGGSVPAFETSLTAPGHLTVTGPMLPIGSPYPLDRSQDLILTWEGASAGVVEVRLAGPQELPQPQTSIHCVFDVAAGQGTIPKAALDRVTLTGTGTLAVDVAAETEVVTAGWGPVNIRASVQALKANGVQYATSVTWEEP